MPTNLLNHLNYQNMLIKINKVVIGIALQGSCAKKPVFVRSYTRVRNGRKEYVRAYYRKR